VNEYKSKQFVVWGPIYTKICFFFLLVNFGAAIVITGARFGASLCTIVYAAFLIIRVYADKRMQADEQYNGRIFFGRGFLGVFTLTHFIMMTNNDLHEENQTITSGIMVLMLNFMMFFYLRVSSTPTFYRRACIIIATICFTIAPPFDVFGHYYEPLLLLFAMVTGEAFGHTVDVPHVTIFVLTQMSNAARVKEEKDRATAAEEILIYQKAATQQRIDREKAEKHADSVLNHNLKNILADGIALVELYQLTSDKKNLEDAKLSMKRGMAWTRRRQSLIMACNGTYQLQYKKTTVRNMVLDCICGRNMDSTYNWGTFPTNLMLEIDPMLIELVLENGISNAIKHSPSGLPGIICHLSDNIGTNTTLLKLIVQNKATPGAPFISEKRERELFKCGTHDSGTEASSDRIGLGHAVMAAAMLGGAVSLRQSEDIVSYTLTVPSVKFHHGITTKSESIMDDVPLPKQKIEQSSHKKNKALRGMLIDDSRVARKFGDKILMPTILGMQNWVILGESPEEAELSISIALAMNIDIIIIDENLDYDCEEKSGSDICAQMKRKGVNALLCIRSGNTSADDIEKYTRAGAHFVICKSFNNQALKIPLQDGFRALQEERLQKASGTHNSSAFPVLLLD